MEGKVREAPQGEGGVEKGVVSQNSSN